MTNMKDFLIEDGMLKKYLGTDANVTIPSGVTGIGDLAFDGCKSLTNVKIPSGVISIGVLAFGACESLTNITIHDSVIEIGNRAFLGCKGLADQDGFVIVRGT